MRDFQLILEVPWHGYSDHTESDVTLIPGIVRAMWEVRTDSADSVKSLLRARLYELVENITNWREPNVPPVSGLDDLIHTFFQKLYVLTRDEGTCLKWVQFQPTFGEVMGVNMTHMEKPI